MPSPAATRPNRAVHPRTVCPITGSAMVGQARNWGSPPESSPAIHVSPASSAAATMAARASRWPFGTVTRRRPGGIPAPFGQLAAAVLAGDGPMAVRLAREVGVLAPDPAPDPRLILELLHPIVATAAGQSFTYSRPWLRGLMAHFTEPRFAPALRTLTPPREYALVWRATLSAAALFSQLGATVPTRGFHLTYSPGFRDGILARSG
jgi:hypothetical protein